MLKACEYGTMEKNVFVGLHKMSIKITHAYFQKCIMWLNKLTKGCQGWTKMCMNQIMTMEIEHTSRDKVRHLCSTLSHGVNF